MEKQFSPKKHWSVDESNPHTPYLTELIPSANSIQEATFVFLKANKSESHNPRPQVPLHVPSRLLSWNFEIAEAELIWQGINLPSTCSLYPASARPIENTQQRVTKGKEVLPKSRIMEFLHFIILFNGSKKLWWFNLLAFSTWTISSTPRWIQSSFMVY